jgi:hypothetical protein
MGFALGGELCWLGRMLLIFPFSLHSWQKYFVSQWPCTNGQAKISRILRTSIQLTHLTTPRPNPNLPLKKQEPQKPPPGGGGGGGGWGLKTRREKMMTKIHGFSINNRDQLSAVSISSGPSLAYWQTVEIQYSSSSSTGAASTHVCRIINYLILKTPCQ